MRCLGRTKLWHRCEKNCDFSSLGFCHLHKNQSLIFLFGTITFIATLAGIYRDAIEPNLSSDQIIETTIKKDSSILKQEYQRKDEMFKNSTINNTKTKLNSVSKKNLYKKIIDDYEKNKFKLSDSIKYNIRLEYKIDSTTNDKYLGYIVASYYGLGLKEKALEVIMKRDVSIPNWNYFLIVDLIYCLPNTELASRIETMKYLRSKYRSKMLSYVWTVTDPTTIYNVFSGRHYSNNIRLKGTKEYDEIKYIIRNFPDDPFLDFAYYLIGEYQMAVDYNPVSRFIDIYLFALYQKGLINNLPKKSEFIPGIKNKIFQEITNETDIKYIKNKIRNLNFFLENYNNSFHRYDLCFYLGWLELKIGNLRKSYIWFEKAKSNFDVEFIQTIQLSILKKLTIDEQLELIQLRNIIEQSRYSDYYIAQKETLYFIEGISKLNNMEALEKIGKITGMMFRKDVLNGYLKRLVDSKDLDYIINLIQQIKIRNIELYGFIDKKLLNISNAINKAKTLRDLNILNIKYRKIDRSVSLSIIKYAIKKYGKNKDIDYSYYLMVRTLVDYRSHEVIPIVAYMESKFPESQYLDDVIAESIYVQLKVFNLPKQGIKTIKKLILKHPKGNAIDEANEWLQKYFLNSCNKYYLASETPTGICLYEKEILQEIKQIIESSE